MGIAGRAVGGPPRRRLYLAAYFILNRAHPVGDYAIAAIAGGPEPPGRMERNSASFIS